MIGCETLCSESLSIAYAREDFPRVNPRECHRLRGMTARPVDRFDDAFRLPPRLRDHEIESMIISSFAGKFNIRRITDFVQIEPSCYVLVKQVGHHWRGKIEHVINREHSLYEVVFAQCENSQASREPLVI